MTRNDRKIPEEDVILTGGTMKDYAKSMEKIMEIRKGDDQYETLTRSNMKQYRKYIGKLSWLAQGTTTDLSYISLTMCKKNGMASIADLYNMNRVLNNQKIVKYIRDVLVGNKN